LKNSFLVNVTEFSNLLELPGVWGKKDFSEILELLEYGDQSDLSDDDLKEVCIMSLQDLTPVKAATTLLEYKMKSSLNPGQIKNAAGNMVDEKLWEEFADPAQHEAFFNVGSLLYKAFPSVFPKTDAVRMSFEVSGSNEKSKTVLKKPLNESFVIRLLADGMDNGSSLHRMYDDQLSGTHFKEAQHIIWTVEEAPAGVGENKVLTVTSSGFWLDPLEHIENFESSAYADEA
jgi:hypothetical protein